MKTGAEEGVRPSLSGRVRLATGRLWVRLLLVNVVVVLVPAAGLDFARIYERQLLYALEKDMNDQAALTRAVLEDDLGRQIPLVDPRHESILKDAARRTRMRVRVLDLQAKVVVDSHGAGAPEGPEPAPPRILRGAYSEGLEDTRASVEHWPEVMARKEVKLALSGVDAAQTRVARKPRAVFLFSATPVLGPGPSGTPAVAGVVYVTRSTSPVLFELYRIRAGLIKVLVVALFLSMGTTLLLALSISRPLSRLSRAAKRIAAGERGVTVPVAGTGEIHDLSESFKTMTEELDRRLSYISEFSADVAHEFKSPLTSIRGAAELLSEGAHADVDARERFLRNILLDTDRLDRLVSRLLVLSRIEASLDEMTPVDLRSLLERLTRRAGERGPVTLSYETDQTWVRGREAELETAFGNLIENAQRYSPEGKSVTVSAAGAPGGVRITVSDEGPGVSEPRKPKIFGRFYTTDADRG
ncbi:MAG TPA: histidine kinase dimerization/phospho-acceptor domain-containing protein, partial [Polyangiaceae bacterium]